MNEIYKKLTTIKYNKFKLRKVKKITFSFSKVNFSLLEKENPSKKVDFFYFHSHERSKLPAHEKLNNLALLCLCRSMPMSSCLIMCHSWPNT